MTRSPFLPPAGLFDLADFDWRTIAAGHPSACRCQCCETVRREDAAWFDAMLASAPEPDPADDWDRLRALEPYEGHDEPTVTPAPWTCPDCGGDVHPPRLHFCPASAPKGVA